MTRKTALIAIFLLSGGATLLGVFQQHIFGPGLTQTARPTLPLICDPIDPPEVYGRCLERGGVTPLLQ
ncbi:MAG: hypothetical protein AAFW64_10605 [Pseudomonadota bacterium]